jgi:2-dehydropantoate 2-reductase
VSAPEPIVIWGAGAIGGTIGAWWARAGVPVLLVDIVREHVEVCRTAGLAIEGPVEQFTQVIPAATPEELKGSYSRIVLAVKAPATEAALERLAPHLKPDGYVLSAQNGLNEMAIARRLGAERTMGCFVNFGADWLGPGRIIRGNRASVVVGEIDGSVRERTREMHRLLQVFEPEAVLTDNIWGYLWGKLAYGAMLFATALNDDSISANFDDPARFVVFDRLAREVMQVAAARKVRPLGFSGFDPAAFFPGAPEARSRASVADLAEFNRHSAKTHSGIWRDLAVRRRKTEIDPQIGIIAALGREAGVETPLIRRLVELIHDVEDGKRQRSLETFRILIDACRSPSPAASLS